MASVDIAFGQGGGAPAATDDTLQMNCVAARMSPYMADEGAGSQTAPPGIRRQNFAALRLIPCMCTTIAQRPVGNRQTDR